MKKEPVLLFILAAIQFSHILDFMIIMPLGSQFMRLFDINPQQFSLIVSAYAISAFTMGLLGAGYIDRMDRKTALLVNYTGFALGTLMCAFATSYPLFLAARALTGAFGGLLGALVFSIVSDVVPFERRARAVGIVMTAFSVSSVAGVPLGVYLAAQYSWRAPFLLIAGLAVLLIGVIAFALPPMNRHRVAGVTHQKPLEVLGEIARDGNQVRALLFTVVLMLGHFSIIPFIAPYMQLNIGFSDHQVTYVYLAGGILSVFVLPLTGRLSDLYGSRRVFTFASLLAFLSILTITHLPPVSMVAALLATSSFFVAAGGRTVPAMAMVTSVVSPAKRGGFMSVRASANELGLALASFISGLIVTKNPDGSLGHYPLVGYFAIGMSILAVFLAGRLSNREVTEVVPEISVAP
jgi:predicted MFS family arabinose efflux permease